MSLTTKIVLGIVLGIATGLFLGDFAAPFSIGGDIFIGLLQMTVLPYIVVALVGNIGRIRWSERRGLLIAAAATLGGLLLFGVSVLALAPLAFPRLETASFFSSSLIEAPAHFDFVSLYVPSNPFDSLANNIVPAVVLFSILLGAGLSGVPGNEGLLRSLDVLATGLNRINKAIIRITPVGVFAIAAGTAGTISLAELSRLQAYVLVYTTIALYLTFVALPLLVTAVTPFRYRDLLLIPRNTLITIFATAKIIVVLPQLIEDIKEIFRRYGIDDEESESGADILVPLAYPFPNLGTYSILVFIPFAAWYLGRALDPADHLLFQCAALLSSFVAPIIGIPFLLDLMNLPSDMMELFVVSTVYTDRIRVLAGASHLIALTLIVLAWVRGHFRVDPKRAAVNATICAITAGVLTLALRAALLASTGPYTTDDALVQMHWMKPSRVETRTPSVAVADPAAGFLDRKDLVLQRGALRVGYLADSLPFAFVNAAGETVGFDIELAHFLAHDLDVALEIVRIERVEIDAALQDGRIDILMSGLAMTPRRIARWDFPRSPLDLNLGFLVRDHRRGDFRDLRTMLQLDSLRVGAVQGADRAFIALIRDRFPNAEVVEIESPRPFLRGQVDDLDAVVHSAEGGSAWTLIYPDFSVVVPTPLALRVPAGYPIPRDQAGWRNFLSEWIHLKQKDGTLDALFEHWILGGGSAKQEPRWSVIRDVLGWVE